MRPALLLFALTAWGAARAAEPCRIEVVERDGGWPVPLVELRTTHQAAFVSDNAGVIAFDLPECLGRETWFEVRGHGYEVPADGFGMRGVRLTPEPGKTLRVEVTRKNVARRVGRLTGAGLLAESRKLGGPGDGAESGVAGQDSVQAAVHRGRMYWFWGDTALPGRGLGIFDATGATTDPRPAAPLVPPLRWRLNYFTNAQGEVRAVAPLGGEGPTWISGLASVPDRSGTPRLVCAAAKVRAFLDVYQWRLAVWNEEREVFESVRTVWTKSRRAPQPPPVPEGHAVRGRDGSGREWLWFGNPFPTLRCPATFEAWGDPATWEPVKPPRTVRGAGGEVLTPHSGGMGWHPWRKRWVAVFMRRPAPGSALSEAWYAEADAPTGPWGPAVRVLSHDNYTFYNPRLHLEWASDAEPALYFEGTYTCQFTDHAAPTPRYDYNQVLYRLDLDAASLAPARGR